MTEYNRANNDVTGLEDYKFYEVLFECNPFICNPNELTLRIYKSDEDFEEYEEVTFDNEDDYAYFVAEREEL